MCSEVFKKPVRADTRPDNQSHSACSITKLYENKCTTWRFLSGEGGRGRDLRIGKDCDTVTRV